jgi:membrane protein YqaA with SNARE-associated domain
MPQSKKRKPHHEFHPEANTSKANKNNSAVLVAVIFFCLLGIGIAYFTAGASILWLLIGAVAGGVAGYFFGHQIDKALSKK